MRKLFFALTFILCSILAQAQQTIGTFINEPEALNAYTLFSVTFGRSTYIIDNCGEKINEWTHEQRAGLAGYLMPDGRLLRAATIGHPRISQTSQGGLIEIYNWDGTLDWSYDFTDDFRTQHHELHYMPNGNILMLAWEYISAIEVEDMGRNTDEYNLRALYSEALYEIKPIGTDSAEIVWEWHIKDHFVQDYDDTKLNYVENTADHPRKLDFNYQGISNWSTTDWFHCNGLDYNEARDEIVVNFRNGNELFIIDHSTTTAEAATSSGGNRGFGGDFLFRWGSPPAVKQGSDDDIKLYGSHGISWIPTDLQYGGSIILFNNGTERPGPNYSTIEIITPELDANDDYVLNGNGLFSPQEAELTFSPSTDFLSNYQSNTEMLVNNHIFTNRGDNGHFVEFDMEGNVVWEYVNPAGSFGPATQGDSPPSSSVFMATRVPVDHPAFDGKDLTPRGVIELDSDHSDCEIYSSTFTYQNKSELIEIYSDGYELFYDLGQLDHLGIKIELFNMNGQKVNQFFSTQQEGQFNLATIPTGIYLARVIDDSNGRSLYSKTLPIFN